VAREAVADRAGVLAAVQAAGAVAVISEQLTLGGMPKRLFSATPSRLAAFDCPRRYRMTYLDRPALTKGSPWAHNSVGAAVHTSLHRWWDLDTPRRTPEAAGALLVRNFLRDGFRDDTQVEQWTERARDWVTGYAATLDPTVEPVGTERTVAVRTEGLALSGRVDRIDERDGELVIVDYKTGRHAPTVDDVRGSQALAIYALAAQRTLRKPCSRVELHHLPTGRVESFEHTPQSLSRHVDRAEATAEDITVARDTMESGADPDDVFPPRPSAVCSWCDYRRHCPEGKRSSPEREPWSGLADLSAEH
jgi:putative RecB family exonuclease